jgi:hypothetical protein
LNKIAIGGYFALERGAGKALDWLDDATGYQSARSAIAAALVAFQPTTVWVPNFICGAINDTLRSIHANVRHYALTESLDVPETVALTPTDLLICVDYFGINGAAVHRAIERFGVERVLVDASQSLFFTHLRGCTTVYSPRKFLGVPDGGLVRTSLRLAPRRTSIEAASVARSQHLLYRLADLTDVGYAKFLEAEASLHGCEPVALSLITKAMLMSINAETVAVTRVRNYQHLADLLRQSGFDVPSLPLHAVPLCCPVQCDEASRIRNELAAQSIFTPTYWADAIIPENDQVALRMRDRTVYLPCDQRYGEPELLRVASAMIQSGGAS